MPLRMRLGYDDLLRCRFAVSPLCETHEMLRLLRRPERHGYHRPWLDHPRTRSAVAELDLPRSPLWLVMPRQRGYTPDFLGPPPETPSPAFASELARLRATDPVDARTEIARSLASTGTTAGHLLADPAGAVRDLADLTEHAWHTLLAPDWPRVLAVLEADIAYRSRLLATGGLAALFGSLGADVTWTEPDRTLTVRLAGGYSATHPLDGRGILLLPSVFVWPQAVSGFAAPWQPTLIYPARGIGELWHTPAPEPPGTLVRLLGRNRARVLAALNSPATTTALATRLGLAASSVSAHLTVLRDAGLLTSSRQGHQVRYERTASGEALAGAGRGR